MSIEDIMWEIYEDKQSDYKPTYKELQIQVNALYEEVVELRSTNELLREENKALEDSLRYYQDDSFCGIT